MSQIGTLAGEKANRPPAPAVIHELHSSCGILIDDLDTRYVVSQFARQLEAAFRLSRISFKQSFGPSQDQAFLVRCLQCQRGSGILRMPQDGYGKGLCIICDALQSGWRPQAGVKGHRRSTGKI